MPVLNRIIFLALFCHSLAGQTTRPASFDIADVQVSTSAGNPFSFVSGGILRGGRYDLRKATMVDLIRIAWGVDGDKVVGGPSWLELERFDISAKAPPSTPPETVQLMLRSLLAERFRLSLHPDTRPLPAFALGVAKGPVKLKAAEATSSQAGCQLQAVASGSTYATYSCRNVTMPTFAAALRRMAGDYLPEVVIDATELSGAWDFDLHWNARSRILDAGAERITIFDAVRNQLGLILERRQVPVPVVVVDRVNERPTANAPGSETALPPRSLKFEVATIKLSAPDQKLSYKLSPSGRLELHGFIMRDLISEAWDIDWNHMDDRIAGAPKWIDARRYDILAKTGAAAEPPRGTGFMDDDLRLMLRGLLTDRFGIETHYEQRPVPAYELTAVKPKLTKADPARRANCSQGGWVAEDPRDRNPALSRLIQCHNVTMAQFARQLQSLDPGQFATNGVLDATGIQGAWDFTLSYSPKALLQPQAAGGDGASEPNGAISFVDAVRQQLGLKLEMKKRPMPVLIIDHMNDQPSEN